MKRRTFIQFSLLAPAFISQSCKEKIDFTPKIRFLPGREKNFPFLEVKGSYYDIGFQMGKYFAKNMKAIMDASHNWIESLHAIINSEEGSKYAQELHNAVKKNLPHLLDEIKGMAFDYVVTLCDNARGQCPYFPARIKVVHVAFDDPPRLAARATTETEALDCYRRVRDQIKAFVEKLPQALEQDSRDS